MDFVHAAVRNGNDGVTMLFVISGKLKALRTFFEVDRASIVIAELKAPADEHEIDAGIVRAARDRY